MTAPHDGDRGGRGRGAEDEKGAGSGANGDASWGGRYVAAPARVEAPTVNGPAPLCLSALCAVLSAAAHSADSLSSCHDLVLEITMALPMALIQSSFSDSDAATMEKTMSDE